MATWTVTYTPRNSTEIRTAVVEIRMDGARFSATNLDLWGCGKASFSPAGAIRALVQDMATIVSLAPNC